MVLVCLCVCPRAVLFHTRHSIDDDEGNLYMFGGEDYSGKKAKKGRGRRGRAKVGAGMSFIALPQRERKRNYDVNEYFRDALRVGDTKPMSSAKLVKVPQMQEYQFFNTKRIQELVQKENELAIQRKEIETSIKDVKAREARERKRTLRNEVARRVQSGMSEEEAVAVVEAEVRCFPSRGVCVCVWGGPSQALQACMFVLSLGVELGAHVVWCVWCGAQASVSHMFVCRFFFLPFLLWLVGRGSPFGGVVSRYSWTPKKRRTHLPL